MACTAIPWFIVFHDTGGPRDGSQLRATEQWLQPDAMASSAIQNLADNMEGLAEHVQVHPRLPFLPMAILFQVHEPIKTFIAEIDA